MNKDNLPKREAIQVSDNFTQIPHPKCILYSGVSPEGDFVIDIESEKGFKARLSLQFDIVDHLLNGGPCKGSLITYIPGINLVEKSIFIPAKSGKLSYEDVYPYLKPHEIDGFTAQWTDVHNLANRGKQHARGALDGYYWRIRFIKK